MQECCIHLIIEVMEVVGKMKVRGGLGNMGQGVMEEEIERKNNREA